MKLSPALSWTVACGGSSNDDSDTYAGKGTDTDADTRNVSVTGNFNQFGFVSISDSQGGIVYQRENDLTGPLPSALTMDIPGDDFPAFANVQVPDVESIALISPTTGQSVTVDTEFTWQAGNDSNAYVTFSSSSSQFSTTDFTFAAESLSSDQTWSAGAGCSREFMASQIVVCPQLIW